MDELSRNIDALNEQNQALENKIAEAHANNQQKREMLQAMTQEEKSKLEIDQHLAKKEQAVTELKELVEHLQPVLGEALLQLAKSKFNDDPQRTQHYEVDMNITHRNIEEYLADLEKYINILLMIRQENKVKGVSTLKESSANYSKPLPQLNYDQIQREKADAKEDNRLVDHNKFREFAAEYLEKRKNKSKD